MAKKKPTKKAAAKKPATKKKPTKKATKKKPTTITGGKVDSDQRRKLYNADRPMTLTITQEHIDSAKPRCPSTCVVAQALRASPLGGFFDGFQVGASCTKIYTKGVIWRYKTPYKLSNALKLFDKTKKWYLPPGEYTLLPYKGAQRRWETARRQGGRQDKFRGVISAPTRFVTSVTTLCKAA